jgi:type VI secretion system secreted protein VgrG
MSEAPIDLGEITWELQCEPTEGKVKKIVLVRIEEELNEPFDMRVGVTIEDINLDAATMLGKDATLILTRGALTRRFVGIVQEVEVDDLNPGDTSLSFSIRVRPALWMLSLNRDSRVFQKKTAPAIVKEVLEKALGPYKRKIKDDLKETYPEREYCVQYQESDLTFVSRLLEEEGISYSFDFEGDTELVVLRDKNESFLKVKTLPTEGLLPYHPDARTGAIDESISNFQVLRQSTTTKVFVRDNDFTRKELFFDDKEGDADELGRTRESYEHGSGRSIEMYDYSAGSRTFQKNDAARQKLIRHQLHVRDAVMSYAANSDAIGLAPGVKFELTGHKEDGEYVATRVCHASTGGEGEGYVNTFHCIPLATVFRPSRGTPKPRIPSIQTAIVTGPEGEEIHVDEYGRVKVQFYWDREGKKDDKTSCWIRTQQTWAGNGFGTWWVPRIGMEVIVQFVDGDPDRPMVTGCVYNAANQLPYAMPDEKTKSTIKSNSTIGGGGFNEFRFEDKKGSEEIWLHAQKDLNEKVLNDHTLNVGANEKIEIGANQDEHIKANQTITVDADRKLTVTGNETKTISGALKKEVTSGETKTVNGGSTQTVNGGASMTVNGGSKTTTNGGATATFTGGKKEEILGGLAATVVGGVVESVVGGKKLNVTGILKQVVTEASKLIVPTHKEVKEQNQDFESILKSLIGTYTEMTLVKNETIGVEQKTSMFVNEVELNKLSRYGNALEVGVNKLGIAVFADEIAALNLEKVGIKITT